MDGDNVCEPRSLAQWLTYIDGLHARTMDLGLERVRQVRDQLALVPSFPILMVAGTNGKGSTCAFLTATLVAAGYRVGTYTSPHLVRYQERVMVNGRAVEESALCLAFDRVEQGRCGVGLTPFEYGTLAAVNLFCIERVEVAVLEVGLGGRLDAVNLFEPVLTLVTGIALDHQAWLGSSREAIGAEKAGIFRAGVPALCGDPDPPLSLRERACTVQAPLWCWEHEFSVTKHEDARWDLMLPDRVIPLLPMPPLKGDFQYRNAALALAGLSRLGSILPVSLESMRTGLSRACLPGRFQTWSDRPLLILDVAHNPESAQALALNLEQTHCTGITHLVLGMLKDKDIGAVIQALVSTVGHWHFADLDGERGACREQIEPCMSGIDGARDWYEGPEAAVRAARAQMQEGDRLVVCGSFITVGRVLKMLEEEAQRGVVRQDRVDSISSR
jgi:folylpolyglutamate synthase/dihydrofolate synthase